MDLDGSKALEDTNTQTTEEEHWFHKLVSWFDYL